MAVNPRSQPGILLTSLQTAGSIMLLCPGCAHPQYLTAEDMTDLTTHTSTGSTTIELSLAVAHECVGGAQYVTTSTGEQRLLATQGTTQAMDEVLDDDVLAVTDCLVATATALRRAKVHSVRQLLTLSELEVLDVRGIGVRGLEVLKAGLLRHGLVLRVSPRQLRHPLHTAN